MSRTYRKRPPNWWSIDPLVKWNVREEEVVWEDVDTVVRCLDFAVWSRISYYTVVYRADSPTGKRMTALNRRDERVSFKEPGPSWFRNMFEERPLRRASKRELQRYMANEEYEPLIDPKPRKKVYWT